MGSHAITAVLGIYGLFLILGGFMGYKKAGSKASLIAGSICGAVALISAALNEAVASKAGVFLGLVLGLLMTIFFGKRFLKSMKFMPAGLMAILSIIVAVLLGMTVSN
jgi:uncharacterized membrane protein (UPF0136 family)